MAPEVVCKGKFSYASDVWSFGVLIWELATLGGMPFEKLTSGEVYDQVRNSDLRLSPPRGASPDL